MKVGLQEHRLSVRIPGIDRRNYAFPKGESVVERWAEAACELIVRVEISNAPGPTIAGAAPAGKSEGLRLECFSGAAIPDQGDVDACADGVVAAFSSGAISTLVLDSDC